MQRVWFYTKLSDSTKRSYGHEPRDSILTVCRIRQEKKNRKNSVILPTLKIVCPQLYAFFSPFCFFRLFVSRWISKFIRIAITCQYFKNNNFNVAPIRTAYFAIAWKYWNMANFTYRFSYYWFDFTHLIHWSHQ